MRTLLTLLAVAAVAAPVAGARITVGGDPATPAKKRCRMVVKRVHGHKKRVRVCTKPKPAPTAVRRIDVGGYKLAIECRGTGSPTVVLDSGFSTDRTAFFRVQRDAAGTTRVCTYDRAGLGQSDRRPRGVAPTTAQITGELHTLLTNARIGGPYVLGGWSMGGFDVRYYTKRYPTDVSGLVLIDATPEQWLQKVFNTRLESADEVMDAGAAAPELAASPGLGTRPVVVLTHGIPLTQSDVPEVPDPEAFWLGLQKGIARDSTNGILARADNVDHGIPQGNAPLVAGAIRTVVGAVRASAPIPACAQTSLPSLGATCLDANAP
jgi:pimeloyl-ACP methyl ester carboxylesterase